MLWKRVIVRYGFSSRGENGDDSERECQGSIALTSGIPNPAKCHQWVLS
jgi:hypothetical protein